MTRSLPSNFVRGTGGSRSSRPSSPRNSASRTALCHPPLGWTMPPAVRGLHCEGICMHVRTAVGWPGGRCGLEGCRTVPLGQAGRTRAGCTARSRVLPSAPHVGSEARAASTNALSKLPQTASEFATPRPRLAASVVRFPSSPPTCRPPPPSRPDARYEQPQLQAPQPRRAAAGDRPHPHPTQACVAPRATSAKTITAQQGLLSRTILP